MRIVGPGSKRPVPAKMRPLRGSPHRLKISHPPRCGPPGFQAARRSSVSYRNTPFTVPIKSTSFRAEGWREDMAANLPSCAPQAPRFSAAAKRLDRGVTGDTFADVKTISIKQLHARTGYWARSAQKQPITITDRGEKIATLQPHVAATRPAAVIDWAARKQWMPVSSLDSTVFISEDRNGR